jgi:ubiquinone/menaquinone biosynthesis C-methylase UbiE
MDHDLETRKIYEAQHKLISADDQAFGRIAGMYDSATWGIDPEWFRGKTAIDAGCGNIGALIIRLHKLGCARVTGTDLGTDWIEPLHSNLAKEGIPPSAYHLQEGSVTALPFADGSFDFVAINGVLIHLECMDDIAKGFTEGARITKPGGYYYTSWGPCGGVMQGVIMPALRSHYRSDKAFKQLIDELSPETIHALIDKIVADAKKHAGQDLERDFLKSLFGWDFCVFLKNFLQAPTWWSNECTPEYVEGLYRKAGLREVRRLGSYTKRADIRKYFAPLHYDRDHPISKILYGQGYVQYVGRKA